MRRAEFVQEPKVVIGHTPERTFIGPGTLQLPSGDILMAAPWGCPPTDLSKLQQNTPVPKVYRSGDGGRTWPDTGRMHMAWDLSGAISGGGISLLRLDDGRIALTYGHRAAPFGIRAVISSDDGKTWGEEIILRDDGGEWDLGYPRTVQRPDGKCVTAYYFNDQQRKERYIACTIWTPGKA